MSRRSGYKTAYAKEGGLSFFANLLLILAAIGFIVVLGAGFYLCRVKQDGYDERINDLQEQMAQQEQRAKDLEEYEKYTGTKQYIEELAREKLGLVYPGEVIFIPEED